MTHKCIRTLLVIVFTVILVLMRIRGRTQRRGVGGGGGGGGEFPTVKVRYIIHLYWLGYKPALVATW